MIFPNCTDVSDINSLDLSNIRIRFQVAEIRIQFFGLGKPEVSIFAVHKIIYHDQPPFIELQRKTYQFIRTEDYGNPEFDP
jgi:hypothetical protein